MGKLPCLTYPVVDAVNTELGHHSTQPKVFNSFFVSSFDQLACLGESRSLSELTLDGNPVALETWYKQAVLRCVLHLRQLDMKRITVSRNC